MTALVVEVVHHLGHLLLLKVFQAWHQGNCLSVVARHEVPSKNEISLSQLGQLLHDFFAEANQLGYFEF